MTTIASPADFKPARAPLRRWSFSTLLIAGALLGPLPALADNVYRLNQTLTDDRGQATKLSDWRGKPAVIAMEYSNCTFVCSITLRMLKDIRAAADRQQKNIDILVISLDPKNDTPESWTHYRNSRELEKDRWHFLTSHPDEMPKIAAALGVKYWYYHEHIVHDLRVLRVDENGEVVKIISTFDADLDAFLR
uniref:Putative electron transport protein SCO1/SenC n=1 Tax=uncultured prokaryote AT3 TaxID=672202 RepID=D3W8E9_9ZZZZ|nr:putative electron transport protein SCO1/SenC [uncultured prokaryote AT3]